MMQADLVLVASPAAQETWGRIPATAPPSNQPSPL